MVKKLVVYARYGGHSEPIAPQRSAKPDSGTEISRTSSVAAMAKTPSLKASIRPLWKRSATNLG